MEERTVLRSAKTVKDGSPEVRGIAVVPRVALPQGRFVALDGLRGLAAIGVALFHFDPSIMPGGYLAVDFFFGLSGFVLQKSYAARFEEDLGIAAFMRLRIIRLYPIFALGMIVGAAFAVQGILRHSEGNMGWAIFVSSLGLNLAMLPSPFNGTLYPINSPSWSLFYEVLANFLLAVVLVRLRARALIALMIVAGVGLLLAGHALGSFDGGDQWQATPTAILRTVFSFTVGLIIAHFDPGYDRRNSVLALLCFAALWAVMKCDPGPARFALDVLAVFVVSPILLFACSRIEPSQIAVPAAAMLGEISYALYAVHLPVVHAFQFVARKTGLPMWAVAMPYLTVALGVAWVCTRFLDLPIRRMLKLRWALR